MITIRIDMRVVQSLFILAALAYYRWAMNEIPYTIGVHHPDVSKIMQRQRTLVDKLNSLWP